jgi:hypothetical protein
MELRKAVDNLCIFDPEFSGYAEAFVNDLGGSTDTKAVSSLDDLKAAIAGFSLVKYLEVCLHGTPGMIHFANKGAMVGHYLGTLVQQTPFLHRDARVLFASCDIGKGEAGDFFMSELARKMLIGKGGTIGAATVSNVVWFPRSKFAKGPFMEYFTDATLKVRRYDVEGRQIGARDVDRYGHQR